MTTRSFLLVALATVLSACDRPAAVVDDAEAQRRLEERAADERRIAELRDLEEQATEREAATRAAEVAKEKADLAAERARLERDRAQLQDEERKAADRRLAEIRAEQLAAEKRAAERKSPPVANRPVPPSAPRAEQSMDYFYKALEPHGDWVEVERYGYCWQPRSATDSDWRPYVDGNWAHTNYGWTWVSNEPFGWATYHYGRWARVRGLGWVWVPGSEWAPAWVAWRRSERYVGWAPLPPEAYSGDGFNAAVDNYYDIGPAQYNFVEVENFEEPTYVGRVVAPERNVGFIQQTSNVTNINYRQAERGMVIYNDGPQFDEMNLRGRVRRMEVERVDESPIASERRGNVLQLLAPFIAAAAKPKGEPSKVRERERGAEIERGWTGGDANVVSQVREQQKQEARRAEVVQRGSRESGVPVPPTPPKPLAPPVPAQPETATPRRVEGRPATGKATPAPTTPATPRPVATPPAATAAQTPAPPKTNPEKPEAPKPTPDRPELPAPTVPAKPDGERPKPEMPDSPKPEPAKEKPPVNAASPNAENAATPPVRGPRPAEEARPVANPPAATTPAADAPNPPAPSARRPVRPAPPRPAEERTAPKPSKSEERAKELPATPSPNGAMQPPPERVRQIATPAPATPRP